MIKRLFKILLFFLLWSGIPSCLQCSDFWGIDSMNITFWDDQQGYFDSGNVESQDSLVIDVGFETESFSFRDGFLSSSALAWQCADPNLKFGYTSIKVTSNADYNGIPAGQPINSKVFITFTNDPVDSVLSLQLFKGKPLLGAESLLLVLREKPATPAHTFTFRLTDESGDEVSGTSGEIVWE